MTRRGKAAAVAVVALLLAACQATPPPARGESPGPVVTAGTDDHPVPRAAPALPVRRTGALPEPRADAGHILEQRLAALGLGPVEGAGDLVGWTAAQVESLLGEPDLARREEPAEIWQYAAESCVLNLFLYSRGEGRRVVDHAEVRQRDPAAAAAAGACLQDLLAGRLPATG